MKNIQLALSVDEVNMVLNALGNLPYAQVFELITKIQAQANHQLNGKESKAKTATIEN